MSRRTSPRTFVGSVQPVDPLLSPVIVSTHSNFPEALVRFHSVFTDTMDSEC